MGDTGLERGIVSGGPINDLRIPEIGSGAESGAVRADSGENRPVHPGIDAVDCDVVTAESGAPPTGREDRFADALTMIARLPLTDAEKADAVRRLLAGSG